MDQVRILVVDDEPNVGRFLIHALKQSGYSVSVAYSVAEAWPRVESEDFDLIVVDRTMPNQGGIVLLERLQASAHEVPTVLLTGDVSPASISEALRLGAADYLSKPFVNMEHMVRRLSSILDKRLTTLFYDVMFSDLSKALLAGTGKSEKFTKMSRSLLALKESIGNRPACALVDDDSARRDLRVEAIRNQGIVTLGLHPDHAGSTFSSPQAPLVAAVSLESATALTTIGRLRQENPDLLIFAIVDSTSIRSALRAVEKGALDYGMTVAEGIGICGTRIKRLLSQARRQVLFTELAALLHEAAKETRPDLAEDIIFADGANSLPADVSS